MEEKRSCQSCLPEVLDTRTGKCARALLNLQEKGVTHDVNPSISVKPRVIIIT